MHTTKKISNALNTELYVNPADIVENPKLRQALYQQGHGKMIADAFKKIKSERKQAYVENRFARRTDRLSKRRRK